MDNSSNYAGVYFGEKPPKSKKGEIRRTRGQILTDLQAYAQIHNGDTLTVSAWHLLELTKDISRARTHFLTLTLRRTASSNPRTLYSLVDAEVLPFSMLEAVYANRASLSDLTPVSPRAMLDQDEAERKREGALGSVMVVSIELPKGDNRPPRDALTLVSVHIIQPLGLFKVHKDKLSTIPTLPKEFYIQCLKNSLDGGVYAMKFHPFTPF
ncbi:hypothetical protein PILCRDRAFT_823849 [Piloderma croceum F 1598]|uniref:Uncharacterized protein n=1 Tax=Piloderma croceum (strain F 1598) TaxID=765440 RepID=A0A0C3BNS7_PILCF|nr:hypothetical protein PILCRDRAFT_823849 [Piloderma croceum F 1598]